MYSSRLFMNEFCTENPSSIVKTLQFHDALEDFKALNRKDVVWLQDVSSEEEEVVVVPGVPGKKRRISSDL